MGQALLKEAVLDVLFHAYKKEEKSLWPNEISKRAGIYRGTIHGKDQNHIVLGILGILEEQGKVQSVHPIVKGAFPSRKSPNRAWLIAEEEYKARSAGTDGSG